MKWVQIIFHTKKRKVSGTDPGCGVGGICENKTSPPSTPTLGRFPGGWGLSLSTQGPGGGLPQRWEGGPPHTNSQKGTDDKHTLAAPLWLNLRTATQSISPLTTPNLMGGGVGSEVQSTSGVDVC